MNRYLGFQYHRYGDLLIGTAACRALKRADPDCHLTMGINANYRSAAPLFLDQDCIDRIHIMDSPIGGFTAKDIKWVNSQRFQHAFNPLQDHDHRAPWFLSRNQPQEAIYMKGLPW